MQKRTKVILLKWVDNTAQKKVKWWGVAGQSATAHCGSSSDAVRLRTAG